MTVSPQQPGAPAEEAGFDILDIVLVLARRWRLLLGLTFGFAALAWLGSHLLKPKYNAHVTFLVDQETNASGIFLFRQADPTVSLLQSRAIAEFVLKHIDVASLAAANKIDIKSPYAPLMLQYRIQSETSAFKSEQGLYAVDVQDPSQKRAVSLANAYLDALQDLSNRMSFDSASHTREFYQQQMGIERAALEKAEEALSANQAKTGLLQPGSQVGLEIGQIASYRAQVTGLEVQRANMAQSSTAENPQMVRLNAQISELQAKIASLQARINSTSGTGLPSQTLETAKLERDVQYHQGLLASMDSQFERARLQENFGVPKVHVVDYATLPLPQTYPNRMAMTLIAGGVGLFLGLLIVIVTQILARLRRDPDSGQKLRAIRNAVLLQKA